MALSPSKTPISRPLATYSIVARDAMTGHIGVAVQSHWFAVGRVAPWALAGVGAVATQANVDPAYGERGLALMESGYSAPDALKHLLAQDDHAQLRQVGMVDASGRSQAFTGEKTVPYAEHLCGDNYAVQANMETNPGVPDAMLEAFRNTLDIKQNDLADALVAALQAAQNVGGDVRGRQSAALLVVEGEPAGNRWEGTVFDCRVDDNDKPVAELARLVTLQRTYQKLNAGDTYMAQQNLPQAIDAYRAAADGQADTATNGGAAFWAGVVLVKAGYTDEAVPYLQRAYAQDHSWATLLERMPKADLLPHDPELMRYLIRAMR
ncbi:MAG TPA: DUF1028 domain-containing protein [Gammaproteobacteria bacterium]|nr:DUF1028 domain-containing protein [Gammaproteobacteria bacterium]